MDLRKPVGFAAQPIDVDFGRRLLPFTTYHVPYAREMGLTEPQKAIVAQLNSRILANAFALETVDCLCGSRRFHRLASIDRYSVLQQTVVCRKCGLVQSNPRPTEAEYRRFYESDEYRLLYSGEDITAEWRENFNSQTGRSILDAVNPLVPIGPACRVLEIGAGGGWNLVAFRDAGAKVAGTDYSPKLVALANEHGIPMQAGGLDVVTGTWDVIILCHVLEHFCDPLGVLRTLSTRLNPLGVLYVEVPNILRFHIGQLQSAHTYYFSPATLHEQCLKTGLTQVSHGVAHRIHQYAVFRRGQQAASHVRPGRRPYREVLAAVGTEGAKEIMRIGLRATRLYGPIQRARGIVQG